MADEQEKGGMKKVQRKASAADEAAGHNRRISPFDRGDIGQWKEAREWNALERLVAEWRADALALRRNGKGELAEILEKHAEAVRDATRSVLGEAEAGD